MECSWNSQAEFLLTAMTHQKQMDLPPAQLFPQDDMTFQRRYIGTIVYSQSLTDTGSGSNIDAEVKRCDAFNTGDGEQGASTPIKASWQRGRQSETGGK